MDYKSLIHGIKKIENLIHLSGGNPDDVFIGTTDNFYKEIDLHKAKDTDYTLYDFKDKEKANFVMKYILDCGCRGLNYNNDNKTIVFAYKITKETIEE